MIPSEITSGIYHCEVSSQPGDRISIQLTLEGSRVCKAGVNRGDDMELVETIIRLHKALLHITGVDESVSSPAMEKISKWLLENWGLTPGEVKPRQVEALVKLLLREIKKGRQE